MDETQFALLLKAQILLSLFWIASISLCGVLDVPTKEKWLIWGMLLNSTIGIGSGLALGFLAPLPLSVNLIPWFSITQYHYSISIYVTSMTAWFVTLSSFLFAGIATF